MKKIIILSIILVSCASGIKSQNLLSKPEHVAWDSYHHKYLVTNYGNGRVVAIDSAGNQETIIQGLTNCMAVHIVDSIIFVSRADKIHLFGLQSYSLIQTLQLDVTNWLDGMADDGAGNLYAVENAGKIHRVNLRTLTDSIVVNSGLPQYPQDLVYDAEGNRLILVCWQFNSSLITIDLNDYSIGELVSTTSGQYDGITMDSLRNLYVSSWMNGGRIYKWSFPYSDDPEIFSEGHAGPAGLCLNPDFQTIAVPNFNSNSVSFLPLFPVGMQEIPLTPAICVLNNSILIRTENQADIFICDIMGRKVFSRSFPGGLIRLQAADVVPSGHFGWYFVTVSGKNGSRNTMRFLKH